MRIAFVSGNRENMPDAVIPLGLLYVMAATPEHHTKVHWDLCFEADPQRALAERLQAFVPDVVALGMRNIQNNDYTGYADNLSYYRSLMATIRAFSHALVVLGGGGFSVMPRALTGVLKPDFGISGEGEGAFARLLEVLERGTGEFSAVPNLHRPGPLGEEVISTAPAPAWLNLDHLAVPDRRAVDARHFRDYGIDSVQTKRGCALHCDYCTYPLIEGRSVRRRDPRLVADEMFLSLQRQPELRHVFIVDSVFNLPAAHAKAVCRELISRSWRIPWTAYVNPIGFDRELADLMVAAGCAGVEIGTDSGVEAVLTRLKKGFGLDEVRRIHSVCAAAGLRDCHTFIIGTQGETLQDARASMAFCTELDPFAAIWMVWLDDAEALQPDLARSRSELRAAILAQLRQETARQPRWIVPALGVNFDAHLFALLRHAGAAGPLWQLLDRVAGQQRRMRTARRSVA